MIKLKHKVNKSKIMRELKDEAKKGYAESYEPDILTKVFIDGSEMLFKKLRLAGI